MEPTTPARRVPGPTRTERDTMGPVEVAADRYWGAQTERSLAALPDRRRAVARAR